MCTHHWLIAFPEGPRSRGRCKFCGAEAEFRNSDDFFGAERREKAQVMYATPGEKLGARLMAEGYRE